MEPPGENRGLPAAGLRLSKLSAALGWHCGHRLLHTGLRGLPLRNANGDVESVLVLRSWDTTRIERTEDAIIHSVSALGAPRSVGDSGIAGIAASVGSARPGRGSWPGQRLRPRCRAYARDRRDDWLLQGPWTEGKGSTRNLLDSFRRPHEKLSPTLTVAEQCGTSRLQSVPTACCCSTRFRLSHLPGARGLRHQRPEILGQPPARARGWARPPAPPNGSSGGPAGPSWHECPRH